MLHLFIFIAVLLSLLYAVLILYYRDGWLRLPEYRADNTLTPITKVSILIPARNEEANIGPLLKDIMAQYYPPELMEVIVIDDHSTDRTADIASSFKGVTCISLSDFTEGKFLNAYKKKAIEIAIQQSNGELIITTDADCRMCQYWVRSIVRYYETYRHQLIASPVLFTTDNSWFQTFQSIDFTAMQGITGALSATHSGTMCNGANLAYTRKAFNAVNGFNGIDDIASGDDMLLMHKIEQRFPRKTSYLKCKDAIVYTSPMPTLKTFLQQRTRWASKANTFEDKRITAVLAIVYLFNLLFPVLLIASFFNNQSISAFIFLWLLKTALEVSLLLPVSAFFHKKKELTYFALLQFIHIPYVLYAGLRGQTGTYEWKGRQVR
ncbi:MAG: glycosyltransferase [Chitinophagaceae bacterium]|nr:glycosyltransferase [Chitinophagaceae bacterium]